MSTPVDYAARVRRMLDLAENAGSEAEAELARQKAYEAMEMHGITEAMVNGTREVPDTIDTIEIYSTGIFGKDRRSLTNRIAESCNCKVVIYEYTYSKPKKFVSIIHGYTSDLERVKTLDASLQLQCAAALREWEREKKKTSWVELPGFEKFKDRRTFITHFAWGVSAKMAEARRSAVVAAASERAAASAAGGYEESQSDAVTGVELALRDRADNVRDWFDQRYGNSLRRVRDRRASGSYGAAAAGRNAGRNADTGQTRVGGGRRAIGG